MKKTVVELFAGVGGFRIGLEKADKNWDTVWANQWEPGKKSQYAFDCYKEHFGNKTECINEDIAIVDKESIPDHNLLVGRIPLPRLFSGPYWSSRNSWKNRKSKRNIKRSIFCRINRKW